MAGHGVLTILCLAKRVVTRARISATRSSISTAECSIPHCVSVPMAPALASFGRRKCRSYAKGLEGTGRDRKGPTADLAKAVQAVDNVTSAKELIFLQQWHSSSFFGPR